MRKTRTEVLDRNIVLVLRGDNGYNNSGFNNEIHMKDLLNSNVGTVFSAYNGGLRDSIEEVATVIFKRDDGVALLIECTTATDEPHPVISTEKRLVWIDF